MEWVAQFDKDGDGKFQLPEFKEYAETLCEALGASFHEMSEILIISVLFSDTGNDDLENLVATMAEEDITATVQEGEKLRKVMEDARMKALFHLFNLDASGLVSFQEVVTGVYKITEDLDNAAITTVGALLIFDEDGNQVLDNTEFTKFVLQLTAITNNQTRYQYR
jgi:Ca2+-binding EF-hand superfamily protein